ncbi:MAG: right-handed parallel beta-helix repeat-containing protein [Candidatus Sumerlaeota bacterium]|nr:right-handed parallel beta-helix repeat-containing protein [Candidatus Sumerlaeota bacterium]
MKSHSSLLALSAFVSCAGAVAIAAPLPGAALVVSADGKGAYPRIQAAVDAAMPGDTITVNAGTYHEMVRVARSGSEGNPITIKAKGQAVLSGSGRELHDQDRHALLRIENAHHIRIEGLEIAGLQSDQKDVVPVGILLTGASGDIDLIDIDIHHIETLFPGKNGGDAHGLAVYGNQPAEPIRNVLIDGVRIHDCKLGSSESMVLNGNVEQFTVQNCEIHDNSNIGIDFIGHEKVCRDPALDQARSGVCRNNHVYNITSQGNPAYGTDRSADGIYVDGGKDILIGNNRIHDCDIGIEVASEWPGQTTSDITVRGNTVSRSFQGGIMIGGYNAKRGSAARITIEGNTLEDNDQAKWNMGEISVQFHVSDSKIIGNTLCPQVQWGTAYYITRASKKVETSGIEIDRNTYDEAGPKQQWSVSKDQVANSFAEWQGMGHDPNGKMTKVKRSEESGTPDKP